MKTKKATYTGKTNYYLDRGQVYDVTVKKIYFANRVFITELYFIDGVSVKEEDLMFLEDKKKPKVRRV